MENEKIEQELKNIDNTLKSINESINNQNIVIERLIETIKWLK